MGLEAGSAFFLQIVGTHPLVCPASHPRESNLEFCYWIINLHYLNKTFRFGGLKFEELAVWVLPGTPCFYYQVIQFIYSVREKSLKMRVFVIEFCI